MDQTVKIMVAIREDTEFGVYCDNVFLTPEEWEKFGKDGVEKIAGERVSAWVDRQANPPPPYEPTKEDLMAMAVEAKRQAAEIDAKLTPAMSKAELQASLAEVDAKRAELAAKIASKVDAKIVDEVSADAVVMEKN